MLYNLDRQFKAPQLKEYVPGFSYFVDEILQSSNKLYLALRDFVATDISSDLASSAIQEINSTAISFVTDVPYVADQLVVWNGHLYRAKYTFIPTVWDSNDWELLGGSAIIDIPHDGKTYGFKWNSSTLAVEAVDINTIDGVN